MAKCEICGKDYYTRECLKCRDKIKIYPSQQKIYPSKQKTNNESIKTKKEDINSYNAFKNNQVEEKVTTNNRNKKHANFSIRLMAMIIDTIIIGVPAYFLINEYLADAFVAIVTISLWIIWKGQSIGKKLVNIKIVNERYEDIDIKTAIIRYIGYIVSTITLLIGFAIVPFREDKRALHDLMANTYVIHTDKDKTEIENDGADKVLSIISMFIGITIVLTVAVRYQQNKEIERMMKPMIKQTQDIVKMSNQMTNQLNKDFKKQMEATNKRMREQQLIYQQKTH